MSFLGKNIRKIRVVKKMSQTEFGNLFAISRTTVGAYEEGRAEAKISTLIKISNYFNIDIDLLLKKELTVNDVLHFNMDYFLQKSYSIPFCNEEKVHLLANEINNDDFINNLDSIKFPYLLQNCDIAIKYIGEKIIIDNSTFIDGDILFCSKTEQGKGMYLVFKDSKLVIEKKDESFTKTTNFCLKIIKVFS